MTDKIICWWSGGVTSAVACLIAIELYGKENCRVVFIDTKNEDEDTYRFLKDCEKLYDIKIETITSKVHNSIQEVWYGSLSLNVATGAKCSSELKRTVRKDFQKVNDIKYQVFGFDLDEPKRAKSLTLNHPDSKPIYPLLMYGLFKKDCIDILIDLKIEIPRAYRIGLNNNNCLNTGCVQGGIGYWQKIGRDFPEKFDAMAQVEHDLTDKKGKPVTMLKDQSNKSLAAGGELVFLKPHADYPDIKDISMMRGREPKPLLECNGFCTTNDLEPKNNTSLELNFSYD